MKPAGLPSHGGGREMSPQVYGAADMGDGVTSVMAQQRYLNHACVLQYQLGVGWAVVSDFPQNVSYVTLIDFGKHRVKLLQSVASLKNFQQGCQTQYSEFSPNKKRLAEIFSSLSQHLKEFFCDSQGFCKPQVEKTSCKLSAVDSWGTSDPYSFLDKYIILSCVIGKLE